MKLYGASGQREETTKYCLNCKKKVCPEHGTNFFGVIALLIVGVFPLFFPWLWIIVFFYFIATFNERCPICKANDWKEKKAS